MTPLEELRAGEIGESFVKLLYRQVAINAKIHRFPPPQQHPAWTAEAVIETSHDFLTARDSWRKMVELAARVEDDDALERLLSVIARNYLRQRGRETVIGKLIRRLRNVLGDDARFFFVPAGQPGAGNVALTDASTEQYAGDERELFDAARSVRDISVVRWSPSARREGPLSDKESLRKLCAAVLQAANGSLELAILARVIVGRLGVDPRAVPATIPVEDVDDVAAHTEAASGAVGSQSGDVDGGIEREEMVAAVLAQLSDRERLVLAWLHETVRVIADRTGLPVSTAGAVKQRVTDKLRVMLLDLGAARAEQVALDSRDAARREFNLDPV